MRTFSNEIFTGKRALLKKKREVNEKHNDLALNRRTDYC